MTRVITDLENYTEQVIDSYLCLLPEKRREKALRYHFYKDRRLCVLSYLLLVKMCKDISLNIVGLDFCMKSKGKPYLVEFPQLHFNMSHCAKGVACSVSDVPIGVDIQEQIIVRDTLSRKFFTEKEQAIIASSKEPIDTMTCLWTVKEAMCKYTGSGLTEMFSKDKEIDVGMVSSKKVSSKTWTSVYSVKKETICIAQPGFVLDMRY